MTETGSQLVIEGASEDNLKRLTVAFPLGRLICVTASPGPASRPSSWNPRPGPLPEALPGARIPRGFMNVGRHQHVNKVSTWTVSIGRTPLIRHLYRGLHLHAANSFPGPDSRARGYQSRPVQLQCQGRPCEACTGDGIIKIEMHFLPDVYVPCDSAGGTLQPESLEVRYQREEDIADVLDMTVAQALKFFGALGAVRDKLQTLMDVGLGYIVRPAGHHPLRGEAQRNKLSRELSKRGNWKDGLFSRRTHHGSPHRRHPEAVRRARPPRGGGKHSSSSLSTTSSHQDRRLRHRFGPGGGRCRGHVVGCGTPEEVAALPHSYTGQFLRKVLPAYRR